MATKAVEEMVDSGEFFGIDSKLQKVNEDDLLDHIFSSNWELKPLQRRKGRSNKLALYIYAPFFNSKKMEKRGVLMAISEFLQAKQRNRVKLRW
uniref:Uncharacterized protein n=1 Tax=Solanum lycopersicum TaxID=4081 RepID=A0A3Q7GGQ5_SOLLC